MPHVQHQLQIVPLAQTQISPWQQLQSANVIQVIIHHQQVHVLHAPRLAPLVLLPQQIVRHAVDLIELFQLVHALQDIIIIVELALFVLHHAQPAPQPLFVPLAKTHQ